MGQLSPVEISNPVRLHEVFVKLYETRFDLRRIVTLIDFTLFDPPRELDVVVGPKGL